MSKTKEQLKNEMIKAEYERPAGEKSPGMAIYKELLRRQKLAESVKGLQ